MRRLSRRFRPLRPKACRRPRLRSPQPSASRSRRPLRRRLPAQRSPLSGPRTRRPRPPPPPSRRPYRSLLIAIWIEQPRRDQTERQSRRSLPLRTRAWRRPRLRSPQTSASRSRRPPRRRLPARLNPLSGPRTERHRRSPPPLRRPLHRSLLVTAQTPASPSPTNGTPIAPASSTADQGLPAIEASKPASEREPEPAAPAQATASSSQSSVGTEDGTSSTLITPVSVSSLVDRATAPGPDRTPIASISSAADQGLPATEAPKPAIPKHAIKRAPKPERAAHAQAIASLAQSPVGTADGASSTLAVPVAAPPQPSHSAGRSLDRATSPPPNETPITPVSSAPDQSLPAAEAPKPAISKHAIKRAPKPKRAAHAEATASLAQPAVGTADGTSSTLSAPVAAPPSQSPDRSPDPAIAPPPNGTSSVPVSSGPDQSSPASEAPKPAISKHAIKRAPKPERPAHAQATASLAQSPVGTADGASSTLSTPVAAAPPSQSPDNSLGQATSPRPNSECGIWHDWNGRYTVMCGL